MSTPICWACAGFKSCALYPYPLTPSSHPIPSPHSQHKLHLPPKSKLLPPCYPYSVNTKPLQHCFILPNATYTCIKQNIQVYTVFVRLLLERKCSLLWSIYQMDLLSISTESEAHFSCNIHLQCPQSAYRWGYPVYCLTYLC